MEQAVNTFLNGLLIDTHPMVLGNDTLSDALNATIITMNGNEAILLNDMGNRRVDNAYLPSGYLPVGMKEYGGIIYVAAYNPITNKSLIGSFPSPERKIDSNDDKDLGGILNFEEFTNESNTYINDNLNGLLCLKSDSFLIPLTKDTSLHAGDKFVVYTSNFGLNDPEKYISNYNNISLDEKKVYSPKNKKYTLSLGILNSQNEFVDITKNLVRWPISNTNSKEISFKTYNSNVSDLYKFNDGYFILNYSGNDYSNTIKDNNIIEARKTFPANTYAYKLVGPLYLKNTLNHIQNFSFNIYGVKKETNKVDLWIEGFITYNCPDGENLESVTNSGDDNYYTYEEYIPTFEAYDLIIDNDVKPYKSIEDSKPTKYDVNTNLYNCKILKIYEDIDIPEGNVIEYVIGVRAIMESHPQIYLSGLSTKGYLDTSLLGSGSLKLNAWRFYNTFNTRHTSLTYSFDAYPRYGDKFLNLRFIFTDVMGQEKSVTYPSENDFGLSVNNGKTTIEFDWDILELSPRTLYKVEITYNTILNPDLLTISDSRLWFLTTELFNKHYFLSSLDFIQDYRTITKADINLGIDANITSILDKDLDDEIDGNFISNDPNNVQYKIIHKKLLNLKIDSKLTIDENLYPYFINISEGFNPIRIVSVNDNINDFNPDIISIDYEDKTKQDIIDEIKPEIIENHKDNSNYIVTINYKDVLYAKGTNTNINIKNGFISVEKFLSDVINNNKKYFTLAIEEDHGDLYAVGYCSDKFIDLSDRDANGGNKNYNFIWGEDIPLGCTLGDFFNENSYRSDRKSVKEVMNEHSDSIFLYGFLYQKLNESESNWIKYRLISKKNEYNDYISSNNWDFNLQKYSRIWWKTFDGSWAVFPGIVRRWGIQTSNDNNPKFYNMTYDEVEKETKKQVIKYLKTLFGNIKFAYYKDIELSSINDLYVADMKKVIYNSLYNFILNLNFNLETNYDHSITQNGYDGNPILFKVNPFSTTNCNYSVNLKSSLKFQDNINYLYDNTNLNNIDIETGDILDILGNSLSVSNIYKVTSNGLEIWKNCPIYVYENGDSNTRSLLYNGNDQGTLEYKYDTYKYDSHCYMIFYEGSKSLPKIVNLN